MSLIGYDESAGDVPYALGGMRHRIVVITNTAHDVVLNAKEATTYVGYTATISYGFTETNILSGTTAVMSGTSDSLKGVWITNTISTNDFVGSYKLHELDSDKFNLKQPIILFLTQAADDEYIISFPEAELSRSGETAIEAVNWLKSSMMELYELFKKDDQLGPLPQRQLRILEKYIGEKPYRTR